MNNLEEAPSAKPALARVSELELALTERVAAADTAWDAITGSDEKWQGLGEIDEDAFLDPITNLPDFRAIVTDVTAAELDDAVIEVDRIAPLAAPFLAPHPLALRTD